MRNQHEPVEIDAHGLGGLDAELGHADNAAPRARLGGPGEQRHNEGARGAQRIGCALTQPAVGEQVGECFVRGHEPRVEPRALQRVDAGLERLNGVNRLDARATRVDTGVDSMGRFNSREREGGHLSMIEHTFEYGNLHRHSLGVSHIPRAQLRCTRLPRAAGLEQ